MKTAASSTTRTASRAPRLREIAVGMAIDSDACARPAKR